MAKNRNRKAQQQQARKQRRNDKRRKKQVRTATAAPVGVRMKQRLAKQVPVAWLGETPADVAVFDSTVFETLPDDVQPHVVAVREALALISQSCGHDATARVAEIPRSSLLSDWRLLFEALRATSTTICQRLRRSGIVWMLIAGRGGLPRHCRPLRSPIWMPFL
ncbi:MAG: hypothetical protein R3C59_08840 [Planctomycetaceae bacterium]